MSEIGNAPPGYPTARIADVVLRDGSTVRVRPVLAQDAPAIREFLEHLSRESIAFRFFGAANLNWVTSWAVDVDYVDRFALVAETGFPSRVIAHAAYIRGARNRAEVAFLVADEWQGRGISTIMLAHLAEAAVHHGIESFIAEVLPSNHRMIGVFRHSGFPVATRSTPDAIEIEFPASLSPDALERFHERERTAAVAAVRRFLAPSSVAVIGASRRRGTIGGEIVHNLVSAGFTGGIYAVNPAADAVQSLPAYPSIADVPGPVDLAVVVVAAGSVVEVARQCAAAGVHALLVVSAGFAESGPEGARRQAELLEVCRGAGMRLIGPNCLGALNTSEGVRLNATFAPRQAAPGQIGFMSQSGGVGIAIIEAAGRLGIGLSSFVSVGNKADLSGNDFLQYWEQDPETHVALLYLESFGNPRKFARVARRFARSKPLLAVKSGRSAAGARATSSHTGALLAASDVSVDALFHQAGVIRTDTLHELFDVAALLAKQPVPRGDRIGIVTNAGGPGIICADACQAHGVRVPELPETVRDDLRRAIPQAASLSNPVDLVASATAGEYAAAMRTLIDARACDVMIAIFVPPLVTRAEDVAIAIAEVARHAGEVAIGAVFMTQEPVPPQLTAGEVQVPAFRFPEAAARAVALAARHGEWRALPEGSYARPAGCDPDEAAATISRALAEGSQWLDGDDVRILLGSYGLALATGEGTAAGQAGGVELIVGVVHDHSFGPVVACAAGGPAAELIRDVAVRITPLSDLDAAEMLRSLKTFPLLDGYRGAPRCDIAGVEDVIVRVGALVEAHPEILELDCNPVLASPDGVSIANARVRVGVPEAQPPLAAARR